MSLFALYKRVLSDHTLFPNTIPEHGDLSAVANTATVETAKLWLSWPELTQSSLKNITTAEWLIVPIRNFIAFMDRGICISILSMSHTKRRSIVGLLCVTGTIACTYIGYVYFRPACKRCKAMWPDNWCIYPFLKKSFFTFECQSEREASKQTIPAPKIKNTTDTQSQSHAPIEDPRISNTCALTKKCFISSIPSLFQRAYSTIRSLPVEDESSSAVTVLLERKEHQWFETLRHHHSTNVVGVSIRIPGSLVFKNETFTFNRWLEVEIRRASITDSPVFLWTNTVTYESLSPSEDDGRQLSTLLRDAVKLQFDHAHQPLPMLQYRVHNHLCDPKFSSHYGLDIATLIAGTIAGTLLGGTSLSESYQSLTQFSLEICQRCQQAWLMCPMSKNIMVPANVYNRISAALWENDSESDSLDENSHVPDETLTTLSLSDTKGTNCVSEKLAYSTLTEPVMVCGQLVQSNKNKCQNKNEWPIESIQQALRTSFKNAIKPKIRVKCVICEKGEIMVMTTAPYGLTIQQLVTQVCRTNGCHYEHHFIVKLYSGDTDKMNKVRQTWVSSIESV